MQAFMPWNVLLQEKEKGWGGMYTLSLTNGACVHVCVKERQSETQRDRGTQMET